MRQCQKSKAVLSSLSPFLSWTPPSLSLRVQWVGLVLVGYGKSPGFPLLLFQALEAMRFWHPPKCSVLRFLVAQAAIPAFSAPASVWNPGQRVVCPAHAWQSVPECQDKQVWLARLAVAFIFSEIKKKSEIFAMTEINFLDFVLLWIISNIWKGSKNSMKDFFFSRTIWCPLPPKYFNVYFLKNKDILSHLITL